MLFLGVALEGRASGAVKAEGGQAGAGAEQPPQKALRPAQCRAYMRQTLAREFRGIVHGFVEGAKSGSCQHVKLATELLAAPVRPKRARTGKGSMMQLLQELDRD